MADFMMRFLICNIFISAIIGLLLLAKHLFKNTFSSRMHYNLWFILLGLLVVPFIPLPIIGFPQIYSWLKGLNDISCAKAGNLTGETAGINEPANSVWMNDFATSVNRATPPFVGYFLLALWIIGMLAMILLMLKSSYRLHKLEKSALPLQNQEVRRLYRHCLWEMKIHREIPIYSTAFLKSPIIVGFRKPCIYLPIHLISDYKESDMRYILLHELQHYKHYDTLSSYLTNLAGVLYWFNPFVWFALKEMRSDREIACDTSVLKMLAVRDYVNYGNTLINFAEKVSLTPFPFATGLSSNMKQMKRRIINITSYTQPSFRKNLKGIVAFMMTAIVLLGLAPCISTYAADDVYYHWNSSSKQVAYADFSSYFGAYEGSFVLYDWGNDAWTIYNKDRATLRVAPDSTYKIYDALFGLEEGVITPTDSFMAWSGETFPFESWNRNQSLQSAMESSVNWYFQDIDAQLGFSNVSDYIKKIGYGNETMSDDLATYWADTSLTISPIEQVELLLKFHQNQFGFSDDNITAVKNAIRLYTSGVGTFYGKTGTGRVNGRDENGWFIGFIEAEDNSYFFATNIGANDNATGSAATEITMTILSSLKIWN